MSAPNLPICYEIDQSTNTIYIAVGPWSPEAVTEWLERLSADPSYRPGMRALLNLRFVAEPFPDLAQLSAIAAALEPVLSTPPPRRWAALVSSDAMLHRVRALETMIAGEFVHLRGFEDDGPALHWLGLTDTE